VKKKVWPHFPLQIGVFSLLDFGHSRAEAATLEEIKLVSIEFKKQDPQRVVGNHMANCNLKKYEHEESPLDELFRGVSSYQEVLSRIQALSPEKKIDFYNFQKHRRASLPKILQGENPTSLATQQTETQNPEIRSSSKQEVPENLENPEILIQKKDILETELSDDQDKDQLEILKKQGEDKSLSSPNKSATDGADKQLSTELATPLRLSHHYNSPGGTLTQKQYS
jgi:hypothetical protein